eukprot:TRINITY_DN2834_c0_g1_i49.p1 TRINITY_DN2834_c0_g1~~TRINITY_DN2834_c0_g1_i49.p1  ORF type:complete len:750 (-),score=144.31 TRINITY_DN2834_c0_g1_i49:131-2380(-)
MLTRVLITQKTIELGSPVERVILRTELISGLAPFWGEKVRATIFSGKDRFLIDMLYQEGSKGVLMKESVCSISLGEIKKLATATESRRWYAFTDNFVGGYLGLAICALTNMSPLKNLLPKTSQSTKPSELLDGSKKTRKSSDSRLVQSHSQSQLLPQPQVQPQSQTHSHSQPQSRHHAHTLSLQVQPLSLQPLTLKTKSSSHKRGRSQTTENGQHHHHHQPTHYNTVSSKTSRQHSKHPHLNNPWQSRTEEELALDLKKKADRSDSERQPRPHRRATVHDGESSRGSGGSTTTNLVDQFHTSDPQQKNNFGNSDSRSECSLGHKSTLSKNYRDHDVNRSEDGGCSEGYSPYVSVRSLDCSGTALRSGSILTESVATENGIETDWEEDKYSALFAEDLLGEKGPIEPSYKPKPLVETSKATQRVRDSTHVRQTVVLLQPMLPAWFDPTLVQKLSLRQSIRLQAYNILMEVQGEMNLQLTRLGEEVDSQLNIPYDHKHWYKKKFKGKRRLYLNYLEDVSDAYTAFESELASGATSLCFDSCVNPEAVLTDTNTNIVKKNIITQVFGPSKSDHHYASSFLSGDLLSLDTNLSGGSGNLSLPLETEDVSKSTLGTTTPEAGTSSSTTRQNPLETIPSENASDATSTIVPKTSVKVVPTTSSAKTRNKTTAHHPSKRISTTITNVLATAPLPKPSALPTVTLSGTEPVGVEQQNCSLCKNVLPKSQIMILRAKPFCASCAERMKKVAAARGVKT